MTDHHYNDSETSDASQDVGGSMPPDLVADFWRALTLLSRVPVAGRGDFRPQMIARSVWCWPLVGLFLAGIAIVPATLAALAGLPSMIVAIIASLVLVLVSGAMHEDGMADCADGFGGGADRDGKLAIMRDSRIGSYGVVALIFVFALRLVLLGAAADAGAAAVILVVAAMGSRAAMPVVMMWLDPARPDGLGRSAGRPGIKSVAAGLGITALLTLILAGVWGMLAVLVALIVAAAVMGGVARQQIGGHTGDVLGATQIVAEIFILLVCSVMLAHPVFFEG
ncbi:MAG: adenosylcobinamide-GDP ribazoletransferase [Pseudomonadota bacterium]